MSRVSVGLSWWPPAPDEPIGEERAKELVAALKPIIGSVVDAAEEDLRARVGPHSKIKRGAAPVSWIARHAFSPEMRSLCLGTVYQSHSGDPEANSIQLMRDGTVTWRRG